MTPFHFHWRKVEDIINRGGGQLVIQLYNSTEGDELADSEVSVSTDGVRRTVPAGGKVVLEPGESITLPTHLYHAFWAEEKRVLIGEVSLVNDDNTDNRFYQPVGRFPKSRRMSRRCTCCVRTIRNTFGNCELSMGIVNCQLRKSEFRSLTIHNSQFTIDNSPQELFFA